jgi:hypothetical protein
LKPVAEHSANPPSRKFLGRRIAQFKEQDTEADEEEYAGDEDLRNEVDQFVQH